MGFRNFLSNARKGQATKERSEKYFKHRMGVPTSAQKFQREVGRVTES